MDSGTELDVAADGDGRTVQDHTPLYVLLVLLSNKRERRGRGRGEGGEREGRGRGEGGGRIGIRHGREERVEGAKERRGRAYPKLA